MFVPEKVMAGYYDVSDSVDNSQKNSLVMRKSPGEAEAASNQAGTPGAYGAGSSAVVYRSAATMEQMRALAAGQAATLKTHEGEPVIVQAASLRQYPPTQQNQWQATVQA